jgi:hypothetical protein
MGLICRMFEGGMKISKSIDRFDAVVPVSSNATWSMMFSYAFLLVVERIEMLALLHMVFKTSGRAMAIDQMIRS